MTTLNWFSFQNYVTITIICKNKKKKHNYHLCLELIKTLMSMKNKILTVVYK